VVIFRGDSVASKIDHTTSAEAFPTTVVEQSVIQVLLWFGQVIPVGTWDSILMIPALVVNTILKVTICPPASTISTAGRAADPAKRTAANNLPCHPQLQLIQTSDLKPWGVVSC
jgi:hypothetical protein